jgi:UPF0755 protein
VADPRKPKRSLAAFLTGQTDVESPEIPEAAEPPPVEPSATDVPLIPADEPRRPATRVVRPVQAAPRTPPPTTVGPDGEEVPIVALPDYAAPPGVVVSAGYDANGVEYVFEDDPGADPLVDPRYDADDRNWVRYRTSWGGFLRIVALVVLVLVVIVTARSRVYGWIDDQIEAGGDHGDEVPFTIETGAAVNDVATKLADAGIINNATVFRYWLRCDVPNGGEITITGFLGCDTEVQFQAGDYTLYENMTYQEVIDVFAEGPYVPEIFTVRIPEGLTVAQTIERLLEENDLYDREELLEALRDPQLFSDYLRPELASFFPHEGLLFPAFYDVPEQDITDERRMIDRMTTEMDTRITRLLDESDGLPPEATELGLDEYDMVIIASLIEEEAKVAEDRPKISRVIWNRLLAGEPLGIDAAVCFGAGISCQDLTTTELEDVDNPYNTRRLAGLPPTPIASPGEASLEAALNPEPGDWFYYVLTDEDGSHSFAVTAEEHAANVAICVEKDLGCG